MSSADIKSAISIEFGLNISEAGSVVDNIFRTISENFKKSKSLEIEKFGKFKVVNSEKEQAGRVKFIPSKKVSKRINYNFEGLGDIELQIEKFPLKEEPLTSEELEKKFIKEGIIKEKEIPVMQRKLISDDVVKLHNEITKSDNSGEKKNIWG